MQLIIYPIFMKLLDKKLFFLPPSPIKTMPFSWNSFEETTKGGGGGEETMGVRGVEERMKGEIVDYIFLKCYLK